MLRVVALLCTAMCLIPNPKASALEKRVAVLEFVDEGARLSAFELSALTDDVRAASLVLQSRGYTVMTRESMLAMLGPDGEAVVKRCAGASCEVEAGRTLGADLVVSATVGKFASKLEARLKLFDTSSASLVAQCKASGKNLEVLRAALEAETPRLFEAVGGATPAVAMGTSFGDGRSASVPPSPPAVARGVPMKKVSAITEAMADLIIDAQPRDATRLEITDPAGKVIVSGSPYKNAAAQPGQWQVKAEASGYESAVRVVTALPDQATLERIELSRLGGLLVMGSPAGSAVKISGPGGLSDEGGLPAEWTGLPSGDYEVTVSRAGYAGFSQRVAVANGRIEEIKVALRLDMSAPALVKPRTAAPLVAALADPASAPASVGTVEPVPVRGDLTPVDVAFPDEAVSTTTSVDTVEPATEPSVVAPLASASGPGEQKAAVTLTAGPVEPPPDAVPAEQAGMVRIQAGEFFMGCRDSDDDDCLDDQKPGHIERIATFDLDVHEVTVQDFRECVKAKACEDPEGSFVDDLGDDRPKAFVDWTTAVAYCAWQGKRLPSEAEWEYVARGTDGRTYPWGEQAPSCELVIWGDGFHADGCGKRSAWAVCSLNAGNNANRLCDIAGNVAEWVQDEYESNYVVGVKDIDDDGERTNCVVRGGSWQNSDAYDFRTSTRRKGKCWRGASDIGFRCARSVVEL